MSCGRSLRFSGVSCSGCCILVGPAIPALDVPLVHFAAASNSLIWVAGLRRAAWHWSQSHAHFLATAEQRLIPARARKVTAQFRQAGISSIWALLQGVGLGGHAGDASSRGAPLSLPIVATPSFTEFFHLGRAMRVVLPLGNGGFAHVSVVYGYQGAEVAPEKLALTDQLLT